MNEIVSPDAAAPKPTPGTELERHLDLLRQGIVAARANETARAYTLFRQAIAIRDDQEVTWLWLASVAQSRAEVRTCMEQVLRINPDNRKAGDWLSKAWDLAKPAPRSEAPRPTAPAIERQTSRSNDEATTGSGQSASKFVDVETQPIAELEPAKVILAVDDSPTVRQLVAGTLERQGYRVVSAAGGMQALAKLQDVIPDLILLDVAMPHLDGYQICKVIKANDLTRDVPVVMLSGKDGFLDKVRGRMAGAADYVTKPFEPQTLIRILEKNLRDRNG